jgi:hypothetical protein
MLCVPCIHCICFPWSDYSLCIPVCVVSGLITACGVCAAAFENTVQALYKYVVPKPKAECSKGEQLSVSFAAGYIAGVFCAVVSHPVRPM